MLTPSTAGEAAHPTLDKLPEMEEPVHITMCGVRITLPRLAYVNGTQQLGTYQIQNGDQISVQNWYTVEQVAQLADIPLQGSILVNDAPARADTKVYEGFDVRFVPDDGEEAPEEESVWQEEAEDEGLVLPSNAVYKAKDKATFAETAAANRVYIVFDLE